MAETGRIFQYINESCWVIISFILITSLTEKALILQSQIGHFTFLCSVTRPLNESEAGVDLALIQTSLLFLCKSCCCNVNEFLFYATVNWSI